MAQGRVIAFMVGNEVYRLLPDLVPWAVIPLHELALAPYSHVVPHAQPRARWHAPSLLQVHARQPTLARSHTRMPPSGTQQDRAHGGGAGFNSGTSWPHGEEGEREAHRHRHARTLARAQARARART